LAQRTRPPLFSTARKTLMAPVDEKQPSSKQRAERLYDMVEQGQMNQRHLRDLAEGIWGTQSLFPRG
jgi:hypothetical protein